MPQDEFIRSMMSIIDTYYDLKRSRKLLKAFWNELDNFSFKGLSEEKTEELNDLIFLLGTYDDVSSQYLKEMEKVVTDSEDALERMRELGEFANQHR
jgi:hypothetical protein